MRWKLILTTIFVIAMLSAVVFGGAFITGGMNVTGPFNVTGTFYGTIAQFESGVRIKSGGINVTDDLNVTGVIYGNGSGLTELSADDVEGTDFGTLTDTKYCTYDSANTEIDCDSDASADTTCAVSGNCADVYVTTNLYHSEDTNTRLLFADDQMYLQAGGVSMIYLQETTQPVLQLNPNAVDMNLVVKGDGDLNLISTNASSDRVGIGTNTPSHKLSVVGDVNITGLLYANGSQIYDLPASGGDEWGTAVDANILPDTDIAYDIGDASHRFDDAWIYDMNGLAYLKASASTYINMGNEDEISFLVGNLDIFTMDENVATQDIVIINRGKTDVDVAIHGDVNENVLYVDGSAENVGISTATPKSKLDVNGSITTNSFINFTAGNEVANLNITSYFGNGCYEGWNATGVYSIC